MSNPPKAKGTKGETEVVSIADDYGILLRRTAPTTRWDLERVTFNGLRMESVPNIEALVTRPDRGQWLATMRLSEFFRYLRYAERGTHIEVKRYKSFAHHRIFEEKFS